MYPAARQRPRAHALLGALCMLMLTGAALAQPEEPPPPPDAAVEEFLEQRGLRDLLVAHLLRKIRTVEGAQRAELAERLGSLYVQMLDDATTAELRRDWEARAMALLEAVPEAESTELRLNLAKARYLQAEETAERVRLRLATPEERQEAETTLRSVAASLQEIATTVTRRVDLLERHEAIGRDDESARIRAELAEARRLRSLTMYYAGWASYYTSLLTGRTRAAEEAITHFGWLLNAPGRPANVERVTPEMLRYEHVARAAIGCALSESIRGRDGAALLWLHTIDTAPGVPESVRRQLPARRMAVLAGAKRWADLEQLVRRRRIPAGREGAVQALDVAEARLLAVLMLEALQDSAVLPAAHDVIRGLADAGITDLIARGEARQVHDLVSRYGSGLLAGEGFIVQYVRGLHAYESARAAHAQGENDQVPTNRADVANQYSQAGQLFDNAVSAPDATRFPGEHTSAAMLGALCLYYSGRLEDAASRFERAHEIADDPSRAEDALWMAIVAVDRAVESGRVSLRDRLERLATLYLQQYAAGGGDRPAMLVLRLSQDGLVSRERAAEILLGIGRESPLYDTARRHAADLLYAIYRNTRGTDRDFAALRFAEVSEELLSLEHARLDPGTETGREVAQRAIIRLRQVLDAVLGMAAPDLERAERALEHIQTLARRGGLDTRAFDDELTFRRLQVALLRGRSDDAQRALERLHTTGGRFGDSADRLLYQRAVAAFRRSETTEHAAEVVRHGMRVVGQFGTDRTSLSDPAVQTLYNTIAHAAALVWRSNADVSHRDTALRLDRALVKAGSPPVVVLRRFAELAESAGDVDDALDAWRLLLAGLDSGTSAWFEARYESLRLLAKQDFARAREAFAQFKVLYPNLGPEPWATRFRDLELVLTAAQAPGETPENDAP